MSCSAVRYAVWRDEKSLGRVSAEARVQSGSLCWARPRRWPVPWQAGPRERARWRPLPFASPD